MLVGRGEGCLFIPGEMQSRGRILSSKVTRSVSHIRNITLEADSGEQTAMGSLSVSE